jgi:hypothetical protein
LQANCDIKEYREYIRGIGDSELLGILGYISKTTVPDRYRVVVQESKKRGLIGQKADARQSNRPTRKMIPVRNIKGTIIMGIFICALSAIPFGIGIRHGLKYGLLAGLIAFLLHGGIEWLWAAVTWPQKVSSKVRKN